VIKKITPALPPGQEEANRTTLPGHPGAAGSPGLQLNRRRSVRTGLEVRPKASAGGQQLGLSVFSLRFLVFSNLVN